MADTITVKGARYYHFSQLLPNADDTELCSDEQKRQSYVSKKELRLDKTSGVFVPADYRDILFIIDRRTIQPRSEEWRFIGKIAGHLADCCGRLSDQGRAALTRLTAVVFSTSPLRSYADVKPNCFVYDVDEFRASDGSLVSSAFAASNIVHDANHIWMFDQGQQYAGSAAETTCWQLQIDNRTALGLSDWEVDFLKGLVNDPAQVAERMDQDPFTARGKLACSQLGKCSSSASA